MPHDSIVITDVEAEILSVFTKRKVLDSSTIINTLEQLIFKLEDDMKVQLKRTVRGERFVPMVVDDGFVRGSMKTMPRIGDNMLFFHRKMDMGWITTSPVLDIAKDGKKWTIKTVNSTYELLKGWGDEE